MAHDDGLAELASELRRTNDTLTQFNERWSSMPPGMNNTTTINGDTRALWHASTAAVVAAVSAVMTMLALILFAVWSIGALSEAKERIATLDAYRSQHEGRIVKLEHKP